MLHFRKGRDKALCGAIGRVGPLALTSNRKKVDCERCLLKFEIRARKAADRITRREYKRLENECKALWRRSVYLIWDGKCGLCGKPVANDHNSHHYFTQGAHAALRFEPYCGILMDYACHIGKVHRAGEIEPVREKYVGMIGEKLFEGLKKESHTIAKYPYERLVQVKKYLTEFIQVQVQEVRC